jgi:penicillin amidase
MKKRILYILAFITVVCLALYIWLINSNNFKRSGSFEISVNEKPIKILRDDHGIAYVVAENKADVIRGQGFVMAQDRLFQIEFYRALIKGEGASIVGNSMLESDIQMRVLNIYGNAVRSYEYLDENAKNMLEWYCEGFNEYLRVGKGEYPLELGLLGIEPKPLTPTDIISVTHFVGFFHSQNMDDEILSLNLAATTKYAQELLPLSINLDRTAPLNLGQDSLAIGAINQLTPFKKQSFNSFVSLPNLGSNNWAISGGKSKSNKPILSNDPHVDARLLPGTFYPIGLICPEFKAVGIATPGIPGILCGRNEYVSFGVTNAYGDSQDLFIEEIDGGSYVQGDQKIPLQKRMETIKVKDSSDVVIQIRSTKRGPIISDFPLFNIRTEDQVSLRWSLTETQSPSFGLERLLETKSVDEVKVALKRMDVMFFNFAIADVHGNIAHQSTGLVPKRVDKSGAVPQMGNQDNTWLGFIPKDSLPNMNNPERGWIGTANHDTRPDDYPYYYSNHFSPYYRYKRIREIFAEKKEFGADDLWKMIFDVTNTQAYDLNPIFISALESSEKTKYLAGILSSWNQEDDVDEVGAAVYTVLYNELLYLILNDELPDELENQFWENMYYWNQRVDEMIVNGHPFIDNQLTSEKETLSELIIKAGLKTKAFLTEKFGENTADWTWGKLHTINFMSPIRQKGFGSGFVGGELLPKRGSNQTLNRGGFIKTKERTYDTGWFSSFRMVADMSDEEKIMGVVSGGSAARVFHPYYKSQLEAWKNETWIPYWFSKDKVFENARYELRLN